MNNRTPSARLRLAREEAGFKNAAEAARAMGKAPTTYYGHENGSRDFTRQDALDYARIFKTSATWLMFGDASTLTMPQIPTKAGGDGGLNVDNLARCAVAEWSIAKPYLEKLGLDPAKTILAEVAGDTMVDPAAPWQPGTLHPGDIAIIDTGDVVPSPPGTFALSDGIGVIFALIGLAQGRDTLTYKISGYSPRFDGYELEGSKAEIIGRVKAKVSTI